MVLNVDPKNQRIALGVKQLTEDKAIVRDLALVRLAVTPAKQAKLRQTLKLFNATVVDKTAKSWTIEITGTPTEIESFFQLVKPWKILAVARTGATAVQLSD